MKTHTKKGMVLAECLTSITILTICIVILSGVITSSATSTAMSRDYVIAQNLANEAINVVEIVRNSNWMIRPTEKTNCWLVKNPGEILGTASCTATISANTSDFYIPVFNTITTSPTIIAGSWILKPAGTSTDLDLTNNQDSTNSKYLLRLKTLTDGATMYLQDLADTSGTATKFYRRIKFTSIAAGTAAFEVKVEWKDGAKVRKYVTSNTITNYP